jgi:hypothetical protein
MSDDTIETDGETAGETAGTTRRTLLKGAVAAGVGAAVYSAPIVSTVPAYATHGLSTWSVQSDVLCLWFSPNHGDYGDWHPGFSSVAGVYNNNGITSDAGTGAKPTFASPFTVYYTVGGVAREMRWGGHPNNLRTTGPVSGVDQTMDTYTGTEVADPGTGYQGGGMKIRLLDPNCEFLFLGAKLAGDNSKTTPVGKCSDWGTDGSGLTSSAGGWNTGTGKTSDAPITPNAVLNPIPNPWQGDASRTVYFHTGQTRKEGGKPFSMFFRIRCR